VGNVETPGPAVADGLSGRDRELGLIDAFIAETAAAGGALLLLGEPGVGETAPDRSAALGGRPPGADDRR
jgi:hypothetical protein